MSNAQLRNLLLGLIAVVAAVAGTSWLVVHALPADKDAAKKDGDRPTQKLPGGFLKMSETSATASGIEAVEAKEDNWQPRISVDGRVLPNPHATVVVSAPFPGVMLIDAEAAPLHLGATVKARQKLARLEGRFTPLEKLDLHAKLVDAEARFKSSFDVLKIRQDNFDRISRNSTGSFSPAHVDAAAVQLSEAKMAHQIAHTQRDLWKDALESAGKKSIVVPILAPIAGEIAEIAAQPGVNVEAGQLLVRIVDFRRVLVRLDFPITNGNGAAPSHVELETPMPQPETPLRCRAALRGKAAQVEIGLQKASYLYEIAPSDHAATPNWRPGLYVSTSVPDPAKSVQAARLIPASALLIHQGRTLVYVKRDADRYRRFEVEVLGREGDTLYVADRGWEDTIVVCKGAQILLSEEFRGDEDD